MAPVSPCCAPAQLLLPSHPTVLSTHLLWCPRHTCKSPQPETRWQQSPAPPNSSVQPLLPPRCAHHQRTDADAVPLTVLVDLLEQADPIGTPPASPQGVKEFKCEVCGREFTLQANMKRHMLIHTSVRPYQCHICFKTFVQKQTLKTHMIVKSGGTGTVREPFKCPYCSSKFNLKGNLSRHMKVKHGVMDISLDSQGRCGLCRS
uniref:C2H2-type domain-containing protein n=1 Tax=Meleagris gallopavo TaxID=9103 RepID=A0A803YIF8_MELGA